MSFPDLFLRDHLLLKKFDSESQSESRKRSGAKAEEKFDVPSELLRTLGEMYNASQMEALNDCLKAEGITCIQGPPGTGKTTTIMGILSVILNAQSKQKGDSDTDRILKQWKVQTFIQT